MCVLRVWLHEGSIIWSMGYIGAGLNLPGQKPPDKSPAWTKDPGRKPPTWTKTPGQKPPDKGHLNKKPC